MPEVGTVVNEGRPVRVRTKVRRLGFDPDQDEEGAGQEQETRSEGSQRTTRTKTKALQKAENENSKVRILGSSYCIETNVSSFCLVI